MIDRSFPKRGQRNSNGTKCQEELFVRYQTFGPNIPNTGKLMACSGRGLGTVPV